MGVAVITPSNQSASSKTWSAPGSSLPTASTETTGTIASDPVHYCVHTLTRSANCVAWVRVGDEHHDGCVTVICNGKADGEKRCEVGKEHAGEKWTDVMGWHQGEVTIGEGECPVRV